MTDKMKTQEHLQMSAVCRNLIGRRNHEYLDGKYLIDTGKSDRDELDRNTANPRLYVCKFTGEPCVGRKESPIKTGIFRGWYSIKVDIITQKRCPAYNLSDKLARMLEKMK